MFDANMRYIKKDVEFIAEILSVSDRLKGVSLLPRDVVLCVMLNDDCENPSIKIKLPSGEFMVLNHRDDYLKNWFVYAGLPNGKGFICEKVKKKALNAMSGKWQ